MGNFDFLKTEWSDIYELVREAVCKDMEYLGIEFDEEISYTIVGSTENNFHEGFQYILHYDCGIERK